MNSERSIDSSSVNFLTLFVKTTYGWSHTLGAYSDNIHVLGECLVDRIEVSEEESVGKSEGGTGLHGGENLLVQLSLGGIGNEENDKVRISNYLVHLSEGISLLAESTLLGLLEGRRSLTKSNGNLNFSSDLLKGITKILCLSRSLGSPSDNSNILDSIKCLRKEGEKIASSLYNGLGGFRKSYLNRLENTARESAFGKRKSCQVRMMFYLNYILSFSYLFEN